MNELATYEDDAEARMHEKQEEEIRQALEEASKSLEDLIEQELQGEVVTAELLKFRLGDT